MTKVEKCRKRANYVLGYTQPKFTDEELILKRNLEYYNDWTPNTRKFTKDCIEIPAPQLEKPTISAVLNERIRMYDEWVKRFNSYYDNLY
tara:strand:+ start:488 stop:757 length:270 start_codon:yes stop_codon:yes gene_type:complete